MKILMLGWELPPHNSGGLGVACYHLSKALAMQGASIDFVLPYEADHSIDFMKVHAATSLEPLWNSSMSAYSASINGELAVIQARYEAYVARLVTKNKPQIIHAHDWLTMKAAVVAKKTANVPLIVHVHATEFDRSGQFYGNPLVHEIEQEGLLMADRIIAVSGYTKKLIVEKYAIDPDKIDVAHNALDETSLANYAYDKNTYVYLESLRREGYKVVVSIGRLTIQKGLKYFLQAASRASQKYDKLLFLVAGDGEERDELIQLSCDLGIGDKVFFTGFVRGQRWRDAYHLADMFVMSSVSEPFGLTALEAAAADTAILLSYQSGVGEVLSSVMRFEYWDTDKLADEMINIAVSPALSGQLSGGAAQEFNKISWSDVAEKVKLCYARVERIAA